jgi:hypothetical protein
LTLQDLPSIRAQMAAGAIPPPLFFEQRRHVGPMSWLREWHPQGHPRNTIASITHLNGRRA